MSTEEQACVPIPIEQNKFNAECLLPYGLSVEHVYSAMVDFVQFLGFVNQQLRTRDIPRLERFLMPANFSSIVGEFLNMTIPRYCLSLAKNRFHNGHPDLLPKGLYSNDSVRYVPEGIEVKASRRSSGWQGHNPEAVWLMVFQFSSNTVSDPAAPPRSFQFNAVYAARLEKGDWSFSGRSPTSRRTITASVNNSGVLKMKQNWVYKDLSGEKR